MYLFLLRIAIIFLVALWSQPVLASSVKIIRWSTQCDRVRLRVRVLDKGNVPIQGLKLALLHKDSKQGKMTVHGTTNLHQCRYE